MKPQDRLGIGVLVGCVLAAAALRVYHLDFQSLWIDELFSVVFSGPDQSISEIVAAWANDVHPLGYPLLLHAWLGVFGDTPAAARWLSVVFGVLGVAAMYVVGRRCFDARTGVIASVLTAVNAFHIAYSQEARAYSLVFLLAALSYTSFVTVLAWPGWRTAVVFALATAASIHVHYYGLVVLFGQLVAALSIMAFKRWRWGRVWPLLAGAAAAGLTLVPWIGPLARVAKIRDAWPARPEPLFFVEYFDGYFGGEPLLSIASATLLAALPFLLGARPEGDGGSCRLPQRTTACLFAAAVVISLAAAYARSVLVVPMLVPKVTIAFLPVVLLLIALAISRIRPEWLGSVVAAGLALASLAALFTGDYYFAPHKEQWREAVRSMVSDPAFHPEIDVCLGVSAPGFQYYVDQYGTSVRVEEANAEMLAEIVADRPEPPSVWVLVARDEDSVRGLRRTLRGGWARTDRKVFLETSVERWEPVQKDERDADLIEGTER